VALWERRDAAGNVIEEMSVKQSSWKSSMALDQWPDIANEAAIMLQLNEEINENTVQLKCFKLFTQKDVKRPTSTWYINPFSLGGTTRHLLTTHRRLYFEYCPHGDLARLARRYRAWGCVEAFILSPWES
jgi:hypothetical protein